MFEIIVLTNAGCQTCKSAVQILNNLEPEFDLAVLEVDLTSPEGKELAMRHNAGGAPVIIIDEEFFSAGAVTKDQLRIKLNELKKEQE